MNEPDHDEEDPAETLDLDPMLRTTAVPDRLVISVPSWECALRLSLALVEAGCLAAVGRLVAVQVHDEDRAAECPVLALDPNPERYQLRRGPSYVDPHPTPREEGDPWLSVESRRLESRPCRRRTRPEHCSVCGEEFRVRVDDRRERRYCPACRGSDPPEVEASPVRFRSLSERCSGCGLYLMASQGCCS